MEKIISIANAFFAKLYIPCRVPADKQAHVLSGFIIAAILTPFIGWYSVIVVSLIATTKELYDDLNKHIHTPDVWDLLVTILGGVLGFALINLL
jgi:hypothetical protein